MGTVFYILRDDNRTAFDLGKAYGLAQLWRGRMFTSDRAGLVADLVAGYENWPFDRQQIEATADRLIAFCGDSPVRLAADHDFDFDDYDEVDTHWPPGFKVREE